MIVKDLSRFGRSYLEAGSYIEKIFPFLGVRFIAVTDHFDTGMEGNETKLLASEIKNLINDMYARDSSVKAKASLTQRRKEGSYVGGTAPYGYKAQRKGMLRVLVPDENTAEIVRYIFAEYIATESCTVVANALNRRKINPPAVYQKAGEVYCPPGVAFKGWSRGGVERIVRSDTYTGRLVQGKTSITSRDEGSRIRKSQEEWIVREDAHEPLISKEIFQEAVSIWKKQREMTKNQGHPSRDCPIEKNIFDKILYCGVCGRKMTRSSHVKQYADGSKRRLDGYSCLKGRTAAVDICPSPNHISRKELTDILYSLLGTQLSARLQKRKVYVEAAEALICKKKIRQEHSLQSVTGAIERLIGEESGKYVAYRSGSLSRQDYAVYRMQRELRSRELEKQEQQLKQQIFDLGRKGEIYLKVVCALTKLKREQILTKELVDTLIDRIYIYPGKRAEVVFRYTDD